MIECDICGKELTSEKDYVEFPSHTSERFRICNDCKAAIKKKIFKENEDGEDDRK